MVENLVIGFGVGCLVCGFHAVFRKLDGLYLEEDDAVCYGLVHCSGSSRIGGVEEVTEMEKEMIPEGLKEAREIEMVVIPKRGKKYDQRWFTTLVNSAILGCPKQNSESFWAASSCLQRLLAWMRALQTIKRSLTDPNKSLTRWNRGDPCTSNWTGVSCSNTPLDDGYLHVTELHLLNMNLSGTLSPALGRLSRLSILDFMWNNISGSIPKEIGNIKTLELLLLNGEPLDRRDRFKTSNGRGGPNSGNYRANDAKVL
ncbi:hypothetical protein SLEP1_g51223 [Rubroshorea leprosula]|uniref:Leucine-rich repeat-containing N-terminal plant-type domain-containing protein n=1 Tax=Rubroshorea leprosula TaxID=152421 RepID=A0AAV5M3C3_9ROSI|nr:hypothetical protein SLEP1_g51223 [Rubroshorea leprosula]